MPLLVAGLEERPGAGADQHHAIRNLVGHRRPAVGHALFLPKTPFDLQADGGPEARRMSSPEVEPHERPFAQSASRLPMARPYAQVGAGRLRWRTVRCAFQPENPYIRIRTQVVLSPEEAPMPAAEAI